MRTDNGAAIMHRFHTSANSPEEGKTRSEKDDRKQKHKERERHKHTDRQADKCSWLDSSQGHFLSLRPKSQTLV